MATPTESDFTSGPLADFGVTVSRTPVTVTVNNVSGHKEYSDGTPANITVVFENANQKYSFNKGGLTEGADARMFIDKDQTINKNDKITYNNDVFRVDTISTRYFNGNAMYKLVLLFLIA